MAKGGTKIGTGFVSVEPDFSGFQAEVERGLRRRLAGVGERSGKRLGDDFRKGVRRSGPPVDESFFRPIVQRFGKAGQDAGRRFARGLRSQRRNAERDVSQALGLDAMSEFYRQTQRAAKGLSPVERALRRIRPHARGLANDLQRGWRGATAGPRAFGRALDGLQRTMVRINTRMLFFRNVLSLLRWPAVITSVGLLVQGLSALTAGFVAAASAASRLAGALIAIPALIGTAVQGMGALKLATMGVGDTIKAALDQQIKGGTQAVDTLKRQRDATDRVADAERAHSDALDATEDARKAVNDALRAARRDYRDLEVAAARSYLTEEEGALRVRELRKQLDETLRDTGSSELDIRLAENSLEQAKFDLRDIRTEAKRAREDYRAAARGGVEGMPQVVAARKAHADARQAEADAERDLQRAIEDSTEAMQAQGSAAEKLAEEMGQLPPAAQAFVRQIVALKPRLDELRATAASGLFPGVSEGLRGLLRNFPVAKTLVGETAAAFGDLARRAGRRLGSAEWGRDLLAIGRQNTRTIRQMGRSGENLAETFRHLLVAARPFINWMGRGVKQLTGWMRTSAKAGRENGKLAAYFDRVRETMEAFGPILKGVGGGFLNLSKAQRPLGMDILRSLGQAAEGWRKWTGSVAGQNELRKYFDDARPAIWEMGRLIRDVTKAFFELGNQPGAAPLIRQVRTELVPAITDAIDSMTKNFGPAFIGALTSAVKLLQALAHQSGPLVVVTKGLGALAEALGWVIDHIPGAQTLVTAFLMLKGIKFIAAATGLQRLGQLALETAAAFRTAGVTAGTNFTGGLAGRLRATRPILQRLGKVVLGAGLMVGVANAITAKGQGWDLGDRWQAVVSGMTFGALPAPREIDERMATIIQRIKTWRGRALTLSDPDRPDESLIRTDDLDDFTAKQRGLLAKMAELRNAADRMFGPGTRLIDSAWADPSRTLKGFDRIRTGFSLLRSGALGSLKDIRFFSQQNMAIIRRVLGRDTKAGREAAAQNLRATAKAFRIEMQRSGDWTEKAMRRHRRLINRADLAGAGRRQAEAFGREWAAGMTHGNVLTQKGMDRLTKTMLGKMRKMRPDMRQVAFDAWNEQVQAAVKTGSLTKTEADRMRVRVLKEFDGLVTGSKRKSGRLASSVGTNIETLVNSTGRGFGVFRDNAKAALSAFGVQAKDLNFKVKKFNANADGEQKRQSGGFIVPGQRSGDTFRTAIPVGSFVLNREATKATGLQRGGVAPVALEPGERVFFPDEVKKVGRRTLEAANRAIPRFQQGGSFDVDGAKPGFVPFMNYLNRLFGPIYVMSGLRPGSITTSGNVSNHASGNAVDISTTENGLNQAHNEASLNATGRAAARMDALFRHMAAHIKLPGDFLWRTDTGGNHWNHIHRGITSIHADSVQAMLGYISKLPKGGGFSQLKNLILDGVPGPLRDLGNAALQKVFRAANKYITDQSMVPTFGTGPFSHGHGYGGFSKKQLANLWVRAGGNPAVANLAAAVALAESGGRTGPSVHSSNPGGGINRGPWQIWSGHHDSTDDPLGNARAAVRISGNGADWSQWEAYTNGRYRQFLAKGGLVRMVGDSLGVGTLAAGLRSKIKGLNADAKVGRTAAGATGLFGEGFKQYIFDLGTNDGSAGAVKAALAAVDRATGRAPLHALTLNGPLAGEKNAVLRSLAGGDVNLIPWAANSAGLLASDGVHATPAGYSKRAGLVAGAVNKKAAELKRATLEKARRGKGKEGDKGARLGEVDVSKLKLPEAIRRSLKRVRMPNKRLKKNARKLRGLVAKIKDQFALDPALLADLARFERDIPIWEDRANRADSLTVELEDAEGEPILDGEGRQAVDLGRMDGRTAAEWTQMQVDGLYSWRNKLIEARVRVRELVEQVKARIEQQRKRARGLTRLIAKQLKVRTDLNELFSLKQHPVKNRGKIRRLAGRIAPRLRNRELFGRLFSNVRAETLVEASRRAVRGFGRQVAGARAANVRERTAITKRILPALTDRRDALTGDLGTYEDRLDEVQGPGGGRDLKDKFSGQPWLGQFSGQIFDAMDTLRQLNTPGPIIKRDEDSDAPDHSGNLDRAIFDRYYGVEALKALQENISAGMQRLVPFGGVFHTGGVVPGPAGQERMALVRSGETIFTPDQMAQLRPRGGDGVSVTLVAEDGAGVDLNKFRVIARDEAGRELDVRERRGFVRARAGVRG